MRVMIVIFIVAVVAVGVWMFRGTDEPGGVPSAQPAPEMPVPKVSAFRKVVFPTDQQGLLDEPRVGVFQPTASGNIQSALYGSVRTVKSGQGMASSFHEGIDIAPLQRDRRGLPMDKVYAVAEGRVGYVNRVAGNSNYGIYVVLVHDDPLGEVYTLYSHLAAVEPTIRSGVEVTAGMTLGRMGNTSSSAFPASRSHLHFEVGLLTNSRFGEWYRAQRLKPDHGLYNGFNMLALNPVEFFRAQKERDDFELKDFLGEIPVAFEVLVPVRHTCDYFRRYPALWEGVDGGAGWIVLSCSENGTPLKGRVASEAEKRKVGGRGPVVLTANAEVLGRNGCHLVQRDAARWRVGAKGVRWLEILTYP
jgi:murein DD-endopeptidase MepM/ murein hydrolase activator NlpD